MKHLIQRYYQNKIAGMILPPPNFVRDATSWVKSLVASYYQGEAEIADRHIKSLSPIVKIIQRIKDLNNQILDMETTEVPNMIPELEKKVQEMKDFIDRSHPSFKVTHSQSYNRFPTKESYRFIRSPQYLELSERKQEHAYDGISGDLDFITHDLKRSLQIQGQDTQKLLSWLGNQITDNSVPNKLPSPLNRLKGIFVDTRGWKYEEMMDFPNEPLREWYPNLKVPPVDVQVTESDSQYAKNRGTWNVHRKIIRVYIPSWEKAKNSLPRLFDSFDDTIEHEAIHMTQSYLKESLRNIPTVGLPSKNQREKGFMSHDEQHLRSYLVNQGINPKDVSFHSLDDVEFYTVLQDSIRELKRKIPDSLTEEQLSQAIRAFLGMNNTDQLGVRPYLGTFYKSLSRVPSQRKKFKKAIRLLYQALSHKLAQKSKNPYRVAKTYDVPVGTPVLYGKYKNKKGLISGFDTDDKGQPIVKITPEPKGKKQDKELKLFPFRSDPTRKEALTQRVAHRYMQASTQPLPSSFPSTEMGLMTKDEFLKFINPGNDHHGETEVWDWSLSKMNNMSFVYEEVDSLTIGKNRWRIYDTGKGYILKEKRNVAAIITQDHTLIYDQQYQKEDIPTAVFNYGTNQRDPLGVKNYKKVNNLSDYVGLVSTMAAYNLENWPTLVQRIKIKNEPFTVRSNKYSSRYTQFAILNSDGQIVAKALDEGGATLIVVAREYRARGLGKLIGKYWFKANPTAPSGGFTPGGEKTTLKIWSDRVRQFMAYGWYTEMIQENRITKQRVQEIIKGARGL